MKRKKVPCLRPSQVAGDNFLAGASSKKKAKKGAAPKKKSKQNTAASKNGGENAS